jgi:hypothetical protein
LTIAEAKYRLEAVLLSLTRNKSADAVSSKVLDDHQHLIQHIELVKRNISKLARQYRNVLCVILGEEPQKARSTEEGLFPKERTFPKALHTTGVPSCTNDLMIFVLELMTVSNDCGLF